MDEGSTILHYKILSRIGEGGMGVVYRAEDSRLGRQVALKVLRKDLASDEDWERRFQREIRAASAISHPGIATIYDVHRDGETVFFTMEYVAGRNVRELLKTGPLPIADVLRASLQMAEAMAEAHRRGVVHRDLKPENVVASESGYYKILDFGLARFVAESRIGQGGESRLETISRDTSQAGRLLGTVAYMSPEQAQGHPADARSDVFAIGGLVYEMATGTAPFARHSAIATFHAIVHETPEPMRKLRADLPQELEWIVGRCLAKSPQDRYPSAADLAADLRALTRISDSGTRRASRIRPFPGPVTRASKATVGIVASGILLAGAFGAWMGLRFWSGASALPPQAPHAQQAPSPPAISQAAVPQSVVPAAIGPKFIAVATFANVSADPSDAWLSQGIPQMLTTELAAAPDLKLISTQKLNDLLTMAGKREMGTLDGATAAELARWTGASIIIGGSIYRIGGSHRIDAQAFDAQTGQVLVASKVEGTQLFEMINRLTADLRRGLSASARPDTAAPAVMTASAEAYRHYSAGMNAYRDLKLKEGAEAFRHSIEADPTFAPALMRLGMSLYRAGEKQQGLDWIAKAASHADRLPEKEERLLRIVEAYFIEKNERLGDERAKSFEAEHPRDVEAALWKAQAEADVAGDRVEAIHVLRQALEVEPDNLATVSLLSGQMASLGMAGDAAALLESCRARHPDAAAPLTVMIESFRKTSPERDGGRSR